MLPHQNACNMSLHLMRIFSGKSDPEIIDNGIKVYILYYNN